MISTVRWMQRISLSSLVVTCVTALYVVLEKYFGIDAEELLEKHGHHPHRDELNKLHCSTGSLGQGITVAVGRAIANPNRDVYCLISDGECAEGSVGSTSLCL